MATCYGSSHKIESVTKTTRPVLNSVSLPQVTGLGLKLALSKFNNRHERRDESWSSTDNYSTEPLFHHFSIILQLHYLTLLHYYYIVTL